jgi:hypothetical protein
MASQIFFRIVLGSFLMAMCLASAPKEIRVVDKDLKLLSVRTVKVYMKEGIEQFTQVDP